MKLLSFSSSVLWTLGLNAVLSRVTPPLTLTVTFRPAATNTLHCLVPCIHVLIELFIRSNIYQVSWPSYTILIWAHAHVSPAIRLHLDYKDNKPTNLVYLGIFLVLQGWLFWFFFTAFWVFSFTVLFGSLTSFLFWFRILTKHSRSLLTCSVWLFFITWAMCHHVRKFRFILQQFAVKTVTLQIQLLCLWTRCF